MPASRCSRSFMMSRLCLSFTNMFEHIMPARLNVLLIAVHITQLSAAPSISAKLVCLFPGSISSPCISSLMTVTPCLLVISCTLCSSSRVQTRPIGLCGLQRIMSLTSSRAHFVSRSSKSIEYAQLSHLSGFSTMTRELSAIAP